MLFKIFSLFCVLFYKALLVHGTGYFSQKFQGPFPMTKFAQTWQMNIGTQCCKTAWWSHLQGSKCHEEMDIPNKWFFIELNTFHKAHKNNLHPATNNGNLAQTAARIA